MSEPANEPIPALIPYDEINILKDGFTDDSIITFVQQQRLAALPEMFDDHKLRLKLLDDLASTALGSKRVAADNSMASSSAEMVAAMTTLLCSVKKDPFEGKGGKRKPAAVPTITPLLEETSVELSTLSLEDIAND